MPDTALTVGVGLMVMDCVAVVGPHELVTDKEIVCGNAVPKVILPGFCDVEVAGVPPGNDHKNIVEASI
jgi:hypothetical protein